MKNIALTVPIVLSSCMATQPLHPVEAILDESSLQSRHILEKAIGNLLNSQPIKLADNVFTSKSTVIIESNLPKDNQGRVMDGREIRLADTFSLLTADEKCYLKHVQSEQITLLNNISCKAK